MNEIFKGTAANDKTGTTARTAADIINQNFAYLDAKISNSNHVVTLGTSVLVGQNLTIHAGWVWQINGVTYTNPFDVVINFPLCASGKQRLDRIVFNTSNTFTKVAGTESVSNPVATPAPADTIDFGITLVTDGSVGDPSTPIEGDSFVKKMESQDFIVSLGATTVVDQIDLIDDRSSISLTGAITDVKSIQLSGEFIRPGKPFFIKNRTDHDVTLWHLDGTGNVQFFFPNDLDLVVNPGEIIPFNLNANDSSDYKLEWIGNVLDLSGKEDLSNKSNDIEADKLSTSKYGNIVAWIIWLKNSFISNLPAKASSLVDADIILAGDSADGFKTKTRTFAQNKATLKAYFDGFYMSASFNQSRWSFCDYIGTGTNHGPFTGSALASGTVDVLSYSNSSTDTNSLGSILIKASTSANSGYRSIDGGTAVAPKTGMTFMCRFGLNSQSVGRDRLIRIGMFTTSTQSAPTNGIYLEVSGNSASFKATASSISTSSSSVVLDETGSGSNVSYYSVFITYTAARTVRCALYDNTMSLVLTITYITTDNIPALGSRQNCGFISTITTAGTADFICQLDYMGVGVEKPSFLNSF